MISQHLKATIFFKMPAVCALCRSGSWSHSFLMTQSAEILLSLGVLLKILAISMFTLTVR